MCKREEDSLAERAVRGSAMDRGLSAEEGKCLATVGRALSSKRPASLLGYWILRVLRIITCQRGLSEENDAEVRLLASTWSSASHRRPPIFVLPYQASDRVQCDLNPISCCAAFCRSRVAASRFLLAALLPLQLPIPFLCARPPTRFSRPARLLPSSFCRVQCLVPANCRNVKASCLRRNAALSSGTHFHCCDSECRPAFALDCRMR